MLSRFRDFNNLGKRLEKAADVAIREVLRVKDDERVLIVTNPDKDVARISQALYDAVIDAKANPTLIFQPVKTQLDFAEETVIKAIESNPDAVISISKEKLGKDKFALRKPITVGKRRKKRRYNHVFNYLWLEKKIRAFWSPSVTEKMFAETVPIDYKELQESCRKLKRRFDRAESVRITTRLGTDISIGLKNRRALADDGDFSKPGKGGNLPCGEVFISPEIGASNGTIVFDGSIAAAKGEIIIKNPITCNVKNGFVTKITGRNEARVLRETIRDAELKTKEFIKDGKIPSKDSDEYLKNLYALGELGIGMNKAARIVGNMLEDEKVYGTCHIALGMNYDEDVKALIHLDGLVKNPTIVLNYKTKDEVIMENGKLV